MKINNELEKFFPNDPFGPDVFELTFVVDDNNKLKYIWALWNYDTVDENGEHDEIYGTTCYDATSLIYDETDCCLLISAQSDYLTYWFNENGLENCKNFHADDQIYLFDETAEAIKKLI